MDTVMQFTAVTTKTGKHFIKTKPTPWTPKNSSD